MIVVVNFEDLFSHEVNIYHDQWIFLDPCHRVWQDFIHELSDCDLSDFTGVKVLVGHLFV